MQTYFTLSYTPYSLYHLANVQNSLHKFDCAHKEKHNNHTWVHFYSPTPPFHPPKPKSGVRIT